MVTPVTKATVQNILNGQTKEVAKLKQTYRLGSFGYNFFKTFSFFLSNADKAKVVRAENMDTLPGKIKASAEKVVQTIKNNPQLLLKMVENKHVGLVKYSDQGQDQGRVAAIELLTGDIKELTKQAQDLALAHGHDAIEAYVEALSDLISNNQSKTVINKDTLKVVLGEHFLVDSTVRAQTLTFANNPMADIAGGFEAFISKIQNAFPNVDASLIYARIMKKLVKLVKPKQVEQHVQAHSEAKAKEKIADLRAPLHKEIGTTLDEVAKLRGKNSDGEIHQAWLAYMKSMCDFILEVDNITGKLRPDEFEADGKTVKVPGERAILESIKGNADQLKEAEAFINEILGRDGFANVSLGIFTAKKVAKLLHTEDAKAAADATGAAKIKFDELKAREVALVGDGKDAKVDISDASGAVVARVAPNSDVAKKFAELNALGTTVEAEYEAIRKNGNNLLAKLSHAQGYFKGPARPQAFAEFVADNMAAVK